MVNIYIFLYWNTAIGKLKKFKISDFYLVWSNSNIVQCIFFIRLSFRYTICHQNRLDNFVWIFCLVIAQFLIIFNKKTSEEVDIKFNVR